MTNCFSIRSSNRPSTRVIEQSQKTPCLSGVKRKLGYDSYCSSISYSRYGGGGVWEVAL